MATDNGREYARAIRAEKRVAELEAELAEVVDDRATLAAQRDGYVEALRARESDLATVTRERDELKAAIASHDARRICRHVVGQLTEQVGSLTRELAEAKAAIERGKSCIAENIGRAHKSRSGTR